MSDKAKKLRQHMSKTKENLLKEIPEEQKDIPEDKENKENNKDNLNVVNANENQNDNDNQNEAEADIDPLTYLDQAKEKIVINTQTSFLDLITNAMEEKKEAEKEKEELKQDNDNGDNEEEDKPHVSIIARIQSRKKQEEKKEIKLKPKAEPEQPRLLGSLSKKIDESALLKQLENERLNEALKEEPQNLPELDENKKKRLIARMTSAKQGVNKFILGKALLQKASAGILERKGKDDDQVNVGSLKQFHQILSTDLKNAFVFNDPDVQRVNEGEGVKGKIEVKNVDFGAFMSEKPQGPKKEKRSIKDMILGKKKKTTETTTEQHQPQTQSQTQQLQQSPQDQAEQPK